MQMGKSASAKAVRTFETVFISPPTLTEEQFETVLSDVQGHYRDNGASIRRTENWGRKRLAYPIKKHGEGWYALLELEGPGDAVSEVERRMRISENVLRFQTVRLDDVAGALEAAEERVKRMAREAEERAVREAERAAREAERAKAEAERAAREAASVEEAADPEASSGPAEASTEASTETDTASAGESPAEKED
jgi:small subunit ribosomal protein S6